MAVDPCAACSWTHERQDSCNYDSHVKLFYGVSDRGVWSVGSQLVIKERSGSPPNFEATNMRFLREHTTIPIPNIVKEWTEENSRYFLITERIQGVPLKEAWPYMSDAERDDIAKQTADQILQLRKLQSDKVQSLDSGPVYSAFLFRNGFGLPHGPLVNDHQLWEEMAASLQGVPSDVCSRLRQRMPPAEPYTFTHGDLNTGNVIVKDGHLVGIVDWEGSGFFPSWWEFVSTSIAEDQADGEWKVLLRRHMNCCTDAREFWLDYYELSRYPNLGERGLCLLQKSKVETT